MPSAYGYPSGRAGKKARAQESSTAKASKAIIDRSVASNAPAGSTRQVRATKRVAKRRKVGSRKVRVRRALKRVRSAYRSTGAVEGGSPSSEEGSTWTPSEAASLAVKAGATPAEAKLLSTKITGESSGDPKAIGNDPGGTTGLGLWQITTGYNDDVIAKYGGQQAMLKPKPNAKAAVEILRRQGIGAWYAPSNAPGKILSTRGRKPKPKDLKTLRKAGIKPKAVKAKAKKEPDLEQRPGPWAGAQKAVLSIIPKATRAEGRDDKRTPAENAAVGGASDSDHLTTNTKTYAADIPPDQATYNRIQRKLGLPITSTGSQSIVKDGYRYQLIYGAEHGHGDHIHFGSEWVGEGVPPGTIEGGYGTSTGGAAPTSTGATASTSAAPTPEAKKRKAKKTGQRKLARVQAAYPDTGEVEVNLDDLERRYGAAV